MRGTQGERLSPLTALNLLCLDAPLVAIAWQQVFARTQHLHLLVPPRIALFATAWLIYLADRVGDSFTTGPDMQLSKRQRFAQSRRSVLLVSIGIAALADLIAIAQVDRATAMAGAVVGAGSVVYLTLNHFFSRIWSLIPVKEIAVGALFAAGVAASLGITGVPIVPFVLFAALCVLNCISIAFWERQLDTEQERISIATRFPPLRALPTIGSVVLALISVSCIAQAPHILVAIAISSALLLLLSVVRIQSDKRTALADLVLLTPLFVLPFAS
ncbi:MAG: hypothetical protein ACJ8IQ_01660 [Chthoniobacterales bacterium]